MKLGTSLNLAGRCRDRAGIPAEERLAVCADAGFRVLDADLYMSLHGDGLLSGDGWETRVASLREAADRRGVAFTQSHAPFNRYLLTRGRQPGEEETALYNEMMLRSVRASAMLGVRRMTVHPVDDNINGEYDREVNLKSNIRLLSGVYDECRRLGVGMAVENMYWVSVEGCRRRYCDNVDELCELVDAFGDPDGVGVTWDFGHANFAIANQPRALRRIGHRLAATHVQDNRGIVDSHLPPMIGGNIRWEEIMPVLYEIGYKGDFMFETQAYLRNFPYSLMPAGAELAHSIGMRLMSMYDAAAHS